MKAQLEQLSFIVEEAPVQTQVTLRQTLNIMFPVEYVTQQLLRLSSGLSPLRYTMMRYFKVVYFKSENIR